MAQLYGVDVSEAQGQINWDALNAVSNFAVIRSCFGTARKDHQFDRNKSEAHRVQAAAGPLGIGCYHYAYPEYNSPQAEAAYFADNVTPLAAGDLLALDWEEQYNGDHVAWCLQFLQAVTARTGIRPLIYLNQSTITAHNWSPVINGGFGLWLADWDGNKAGPGVHTPWPFTAMRQWTDADTVAGISGHVDGDVFYGDFAAWAAYARPTPAHVS
jgi:lysozyme